MCISSRADMAARHIRTLLLLATCANIGLGKGSRRHNLPLTHHGSAAVEKSLLLSFEGQGKLGIAFVKGVIPPTVRHVSAGSWASRHNVETGMVLQKIGDEALDSTSYGAAIELLRRRAAASTPRMPLSLQLLPPSGARVQLLSRACTALRARDLDTAHRRLRRHAVAAAGRPWC